MIRLYMRFSVLALSCALLVPATAVSAQVGVNRAGAAPRRAGTQTAAAPRPTFIKEFGTMWTFDAPPLEYWRTTYNFSPDAAWLDHVRQSAVRIPGCSASFVSANGLVMTNHHCGRSCTASASPRDTNYVAVGFAARSMSDEKKCAGMWADQLQSIQDVTDRIRRAVSATASAQQVEQRNAEIGRIEQECVQQ